MEVIIGKKILEKLNYHLREMSYSKPYIITDHNVKGLYGQYLSDILKDYDHAFYSIPPGEKSKSVDMVLAIYDDLIDKEIDRGSLIIAFGGGVVGDLAGFIASSFKRGIDYIQIPTSLLAQVDSSIGGKVGIDYGGLKNIIGSFYFPQLVFIDVSLLKTLSHRDVICGLAEILKYGLIADYHLFKYACSNFDKVFNKNEDLLLELVNSSVCIKQEIVKRDKLDKGERRILNFGHTIGHGIESLYDFNKYNHGEAVILGMIYESYIGMEMGLIDSSYFIEIYNSLIELIKPIRFKEDEIKSLLDLMRNDKKNLDNKFIFILPTGKGQVGVFDNIDTDLIIKSLKGEWF